MTVVYEDKKDVVQLNGCYFELAYVVDENGNKLASEKLTNYPRYATAKKHARKLLKENNAYKAYVTSLGGRITLLA